MSTTVLPAPRTRKPRALAGRAPLQPEQAADFAGVVLRCLAKPEVWAMLAELPGALVKVREFCLMLGVDLPDDLSALAQPPAPVQTPTQHPIRRRPRLPPRPRPNLNRSPLSNPNRAGPSHAPCNPARRASTAIMTPNPAIVFRLALRRSWSMRLRTSFSLQYRNEFSYRPFGAPALRVCRRD